MTGSDMMLIVMTFLLGIFSGAYLYVDIFVPKYGNTGVDSKSEFEIIADQYGGCARDGGCSSFILRKDRSFVYIKGHQTSEEKATKEGKISAKQFKDLKKALNTLNLSMLAEKVKSRTCASYVDGIDYSYRVLDNNIEYILDTCTTKFGSSDALKGILFDLWSVMEGSV